MKPLVKIDSGGGYLLFLSESGYVRIRKEWAKEAMEALPAETLRDQGIDVEYDYIEHLFDHLRTLYLLREAKKLADDGALGRRVAGESGNGWTTSSE